MVVVVVVVVAVVNPRGGDPPRQRDAVGAVVDAEEAAAPAGGAEREQQGAVAAAEVEDRGRGLVEPGGRRWWWWWCATCARATTTRSQRRRKGPGCGGGGGEPVEEVADLGLGVGVVEPDGAFLARVGRVVGQLGGVDCVPAVGMARLVSLKDFPGCLEGGIKAQGLYILLLCAQLGGIEVGWFGRTCAVGHGSAKIAPVNTAKRLCQGSAVGVEENSAKVFPSGWA